MRGSGWKRLVTAARGAAARERHRVLVGRPVRGRARPGRGMSAAGANSHHHSPPRPACAATPNTQARRTPTHPSHHAPRHASPPPPPLRLPLASPPTTPTRHALGSVLGRLQGRPLRRQLPKVQVGRQARQRGGGGGVVALGVVQRQARWGQKAARTGQRLQRRLLACRAPCDEKGGLVSSNPNESKVRVQATGCEELGGGSGCV